MDISSSDPVSSDPRTSATRSPSRRAAPRIPASYRARLGVEAALFWARVYNVGPQGLGMLSERSYPPGTRLHVAVLDHDDTEIPVVAQVRWSELGDEGAQPCFALGLRITSAPAAFGILADAAASRWEQRVREATVAPVMFDGQAELTHGLNRRLLLAEAFVPREGLRPGVLCAIRLALPGVLDEAWAVGRLVTVRAAGGDEAGAAVFRFLRVLVGTRPEVAARLQQAAAQIGLPIVETRAQ